MHGGKVVGVPIDITGVVKNGAADTRDDREGDLNGGAGEGLAAERFTIYILGTDVAKVETAQIIGAAKKEPVENWNF